MRRYAITSWWTTLLAFFIMLAPAVHIKTMDLNIPVAVAAPAFALREALAPTICAQAPGCNTGNYCEDQLCACERLEQIKEREWFNCWRSGGDPWDCWNYFDVLHEVGQCWNFYDRECN